MVLLSQRADYEPSYIEYTLPTDADFLAKYGVLARFRCRTCGTEWAEKPGYVWCPQSEDHLYYDWVNYAEIAQLLWG